MRSAISIDVGAPAAARLRARPRCRALAGAAPALPRRPGPRARTPTARSTARMLAIRPVVPRSATASRSRGARAPGAIRRRSGLRFVHQGGATDGMDVTWRIEPTRAAAAASRSSTTSSRRRRAGRRSSTGCSCGRSPAGRWRRSRRSPRPSRRRRRPDPIAPAGEAVGMSRAARVWITGHRRDQPDRDGPRRVLGRRPSRRLAGEAHRPLRPGAVPLPGRGPDRRLRPARPHGAANRAPARPVQPVRPRRRAAGARRRRPAAGRGRRRRPRSVRRVPRQRARRHRLRRGPARALLERGIRSVAPNLALAVFGGAAPANLGIALDLRGPILSTANSCASGAVALGEALGRSARRRRSTPRSRAAPRCRSARSRSARSTSSGPFRPAPTTTPAHAARPFDAERDGFVMGEGVALLVLEAEEVAPTPRRDALCRAAGLRRDLRRAPHGPAAADGREAARAIVLALADAGVDAARSTTSTPTPPRPRSATSPRRGRSRSRSGARRDRAVSGTKALYGHPLGASSALEAAICSLAIRDGWAPARRISTRRTRGDRRAPARAASGEAAPATYDRILSTSFGFGGLNAALVFGSVADR